MERNSFRKGHTLKEHFKQNQNTNETHELTINRKYKDMLFRFVLADKKVLLNLYNALNDTDYSDENELTINTLEDAIYLGHKNDMSFLIGSTVNLYEHQCTVNPNMPLRGLYYITNIYKAHIAKNKENIFGTKLIRLPRPEFIVFYNGLAEQEERKTLRLSDAFYEAGRDKSSGCLEFTATVLNINYGNNNELMAKCRELNEYALFNNILRKYIKQGIEYEKAVHMAVDECIRQNILHDILQKNKAEVIDLMLTEYNQEQHYEALREEGKERAEARLIPIIAEKDAIIADKDALIEALQQQLKDKE